MTQLRGRKALTPEAVLDRQSSLLSVLEGQRRRGLVVWQPQPTPPPLWIRFLKEAPFGTQLVGAQDLHWDGKFLSIELLQESDIEAYAAEMSQWVDYANSELSHCVVRGSTRSWRSLPLMRSVIGTAPSMFGPSAVPVGEALSPGVIFGAPARTPL